jgi:urea transport system substrate-binding protein
MAISERSVIDAIEMAVGEINDNGGVMGRPVKTVVADGQSDERVFAAQAEKLIEEDKVATIIGCWTSASRKAVKVVVEKHQHLLIYPVSYEGMELSPNIIYAGGVPNQQVLPALKWLVGFEGKKKWFLVGSDYVFPRAVNEVIKDAKPRDCEIVGEEYVPLGSTDVAAMVSKIAKQKPELIINSINGDTNVPFFRALRKANVLSKTTPTLSFSVSEEELNALTPRDIEGDYVAGNYIQSVDTPVNRAFLQRFHQRFSKQRNVSDPMQTAYYCTLMWADAVNAAGRLEPSAIRDAFKVRQIDAPQGPVRIDPATLHTIQLVRIGQFAANKTGTAELREVYISPKPLLPEPFPPSRSRAEWERYLDGLYTKWGGHWANMAH